MGRWGALGLVGLTVCLLIGNGLPVADAQGLGAAVELSAPARVAPATSVPTSTPTPTATATSVPTSTSTPPPASTPTSTPTPVAHAFTPIRVNAGGPAFTSSDGRVWQADTGFNAGSVYSPSVNIARTLDPALYQDERYGNFAYTFAVPNGTYTVALKFAEIYWTTAGRRVFNVTINNQPVLTNFDILAQPNAAPNTALDRTFPVTVTNGTLSVGFVTVVDNAQINAIEITPGT